MNQDEITYRNENRDIWCVKNSSGNIISTSEVPKGSVQPEQILDNMKEAFSTIDLEIYNISAEECDEHEKKVIETKGRLIHQSEVIKRIPEVIAEKRDNKIARIKLDMAIEISGIGGKEIIGYEQKP